jgi:hypothetical protein
MAETLKPESRTRELDFCKYTWNNFELYYKKRDLRNGQVELLYTVLNSGHSLIGTMVINMDTKTGKITIIDGQHRYRAIEKYLGNHPDAHIKVHAEYYENLSKEEQYEIYLKHATVIPQTLVDALTMGEDWINVANRLVNDFPVRVTHGKSKDAWSSKQLINAYLFRDKGPEGSNALRRNKFINMAKAVPDEDIKRLAGFCTMHQEIFGDPGHNNMFCKFANLNSLMKIWFYNIDKCGHDPKFLKGRVKKLVGDPKLVNASRATDRDLLKEIYDHMLRKMNRGLSKNKIEAIPEV